MRRFITILCFALACPVAGFSQFLDSFDREAIEGWFFYTGDGEATMDFVQKDDFARISVDATEDRHNVWWAIIKRDVTAFLDLEMLADPGFVWGVVAGVRAPPAPRRVNFMLNTQRTTEYHEHLMEYEIPDTTGWHTISLTTKRFDAVPGDTVFVQLGVTDWGLERYHVDLDYYRADIVEVATAEPDRGEPLPYHPPVPDPETFPHHFSATHDSVIHVDFQETNFNDWHAVGSEAPAPVLTTTGNQWAILRWEFGDQADAVANGAGLLELTTHTLLQGGNYREAYGRDLGEEFGKIRVIEIVGGDPDWDQTTVTYQSLLGGEAPSNVFHSQMVFDVAPTGGIGGKTRITLSRPVLQRLLDGTTKGLLIQPLGALVLSFYASEDESAERHPRLYFKTDGSSTGVDGSGSPEVVRDEAGPEEP